MIKQLFFILLTLSLNIGQVFASCSTLALSDPTRVYKGGDTMTGTLLMSNAGINGTGASSNIVSQASMTASYMRSNELVVNGSGGFSGQITATSATFANSDGGATPAVHAYGATSAYIDMDAYGSVGVGAASTIYKRNGGIQFYSGMGPITGNNAFEITNRNTVLFNCQSSGNCGVGQSSATVKFEVSGGVRATSFTSTTNGYTFPDGTTMTTAASGNTGANNTWTGMNVFAATTTIFQPTGNGNIQIHRANTTGSVTLEFDDTAGTLSTIGADNSTGGLAFGGSGRRPNQTIIQNGAAQPISFGHNNIDVQIDANGHVNVFGSTPTVNGGGCGGSPVITGTDVAGKIVFGSGPGTACNVIFAGGFNSTYVMCLVGGKLTAQTPTVLTSTGNMTIQLSGGGSFTAGEILNYHCIGVQ